MHYEYHKKSREFLKKGGEKYAHLFEGMTDESREARYHLLDSLYVEFGYIGSLLKDDSGTPLPVITETGKTLYWSLSHSQNYIAFVVSSSIPGIDIAEIRERDISLFDIHSAEEYRILGGRNWEHFYILWTAKEAIIKASSGTLDDMKNISLHSRLSEGIYKFVFQNQEYTIKTIQENTVIVSLVTNIVTH